MTAIQRDYYQVLQVDPEASPEVTAAYKTLAKRLHPETDLTGVHEIRMAELDRAPTACCATLERASGMTSNGRIA